MATIINKDEDTDSSEETDAGRDITPDDIKEILLDETNLTTIEIENYVEQKQEKYGRGMVNELAAHYLVARDHGISPNEELDYGYQEPELDIENVVPGINDLQITVTVDQVQATNTFEKEGETNRVRNVVVKDGTGKTQLTLWGQDTEIADQLQQRDQLRIEGGYTSESDWCKKRYDCPAELRLGDDGKLLRVRSEGEEVLVGGG